MDIVTILKQAVGENASDVFIVAGLPCSFRKNGTLYRINEERLLPPDTEDLLNNIYRLAGSRDMTALHEHGDDDFAFAIQGVSRFRVSAYKQRGALSAVIRVITFQLPDYTDLGIPPYIINSTASGSGMILITGDVYKRQHSASYLAVLQRIDTDVDQVRRGQVHRCYIFSAHRCHPSSSYREVTQQCSRFSQLLCSFVNESVIRLITI